MLWPVGPPRDLLGLRELHHDLRRAPFKRSHLAMRGPPPSPRFSVEEWLRVVLPEGAARVVEEMLGLCRAGPSWVVLAASDHLGKLWHAGVLREKRLQYMPRLDR